MNKKECLNFIKDNLDLIQNNDWNDFCSKMYINMCTSDDVHKIFTLIEDAGIFIPEENLSNFLISYLKDMILEIRRSSIDREYCVDKNGNLLISNLFNNFSFHHNGWPKDKIKEILNKRAEEVDWPIEKIKY